MGTSDIPPGYEVIIPDDAYFVSQVPCRQACPVHTDAGGYVQLIAEGRYREAFYTAATPNPLISTCGRICAHPCEEACRRGQLDAPVSIRALKRFVAERHGPESLSFQPADLAAPRPERVAVVGAGPAGLTCAYELRRQGVQVVLFEAAKVTGGMLHLGIPEYRLPRDILRAEARHLLSAVELRSGWRLGTDFGLQDLFEQGFEAVFVAVGTHRGRRLDIEGADLDGVINGIEFLLNVNLGYQVTLGRRVAVVGGGNVAFDVARTALRKGIEGEEPVEDRSDVDEYGNTLVDAARAALRSGAREVHIVALESHQELPADHEELHAAETEGIRLHLCRGPRRIEGQAGRVAGLVTHNVASVFDAQGRFNPIFVPDTDARLDVDTVILAIGQAPDLTFCEEDGAPKISPRGFIQVDPLSLATSWPGVFAGGDVAFGPRRVIDAVADGRRAARSIMRHLGIAWHRRVSYRFEPVVLDRSRDNDDIRPRCRVPVLPLDQRVGFREVESGYDEASARDEARRCLWCHVQTIIDSDRCILCGGCVDICPEGCLRIARPEHLRRSELVESLLRRRPAVEGQAAVILKDDRRCTRCGLCAGRCPTDAITMERHVEILEQHVEQEAR